MVAVVARFIVGVLFFVRLNEERNEVEKERELTSESSGNHLSLKYTRLLFIG
jgi:hypothetical protein